MSSHTFVMPSSERAQQWVDACAKSLACPAEEAAVMLANLCGFATWDLMIHAIGSTRPSQPDEQLPKSSVRRRHEYFVAVLTEVFAFDPLFGKYLVEHLSPSSCRPFRPFSIDRSHMHGPRDTQGINFAEMAEMLGIDFDDSILADAAKRLLGDALPSDFDFSNFSDSVRALRGVESWPWFNIFMDLGWGPLDETYNEEPVEGEPAFLIDDQVHGLVPVFLSPFSRTPNDYNDKGADASMRCALEAYREGHALGDFGDTAYLLWSFPLSKEINGEHYCHLGMLLRDGEWKEALINEHVDSFAKLYRLNAQLASIEDGHPELADQGQRFFNGVNRHMAGLDQPGVSDKGWEVLQAGSFSGWKQVQYIRKGN
ncbi:TPA: hypothetical protein ACWLUJ_005743 [Pseudomonas aeruginosa]|nr:hypothetical protein [Pseudomonas aeruginosa]